MRSRLSLARRGPALRIEESSSRALRGAPLRSRARATGVARAYRRRCRTASQLLLEELRPRRRAPAVLELPSPPCVARRAGAPSAMRQLGELLKRHRHCTRRAPAARSRGPSCRSGRRGPSSRRVAQHLRLPYHSHVPVGARANVALWLCVPAVLVASTSCLRLVVGPAGGARPPGEGLGGGLLRSWGLRA